MKTFAFRLLPNQDLKKELIKVVEKNKIKAGVILTCVGSLKKTNIRLADEKEKEFKGLFEIVSLVGTLCKDGCHLHISLSDKKGNTIGGHLKDNCIIHTTAEIVILDLDKTFKREFDKKTGFKGPTGRFNKLPSRIR